MSFDQAAYDVCCEWSLPGVAALAPGVNIAGAIIRQLVGSLSPEAQAAADLYRGSMPDFASRLQQCSSGRELIVGGLSKMSYGQKTRTWLYSRGYAPVSPPLW
jgi:hypothetical protein